MRIISKQHDYYDCIQAYGDDDSCMYKRKSESITIQNVDFPFIEELKKYIGLKFTCSKWVQEGKIREIEDYYSVLPVFILFCSKVYPCLKCTHREIEGVRYIYEFDKINEIKTIFLKDKDELQHFTRHFNYKMQSRWGKKTKSNMHLYEEFFRLKDTLDCSNLMLEHSIPYFSLHSKDFDTSIYNKKHNYDVTLMGNPSLKEHEFYQVKTAFEAYTDIRNFISQQLGGNSPKMVDISNDDMIVKKGFDTKISFRKGKTKNK